MWGRGHRGPGTQTACLQHSAPCNQGLSCSPWDWRVVEMPPAHPASPGPVRNNPRRHFSGPGCSSLAKGEWPVPHRTSPCLFAEPWEPVELSEQFLLRGHSWPGCLWPLPWAPGSSWWKPRCLASAPPCPCAGRAWVGSSRDEKVRSCLCLPLSVGSHLWGLLPRGLHRGPPASSSPR